MLPSQPVLPPHAARRTHRRSGWRQTALASLLCAALGSGVAWAQTDEYAEVNRLLRAGQSSEALSQLERYLANHPRDPQLRFLKGVIQSESGKPAEAITTFTKLTEDFPELPEPYNNLAVLYAGQSQFDKARAALEMAIRTNPSYATAHENLGDVYAKLASQAYSKALQLDTANSGVPPKLSLIRNIFTSGASPALAPVAAAKPVAAAAAVAPAPAPAVPLSAKPAVTPAAPAAGAAGAPASATDAQPEVRAAVAAWAKAWSSRDMGAYLGAYGPGFVPAGGQSRSAWEADRKARIVPRSRIEVEVSDLTIEVNGNRASARFQQAYRSDSLNVSSRKTLELARSGGRWLIVRESTGS